MTRPDDPSDDMARFPSPADAEGLLSGRLAVDDLPEEAAPLARLLAGLEPIAVNDPFTERRVVSDITAEILRNPAPESMPSVLRTGIHRIPAKTGAALAFVAVLATGTAAAAANGSLPPSIQRAVSDVLSHVSISVPHPSQHHPVESHRGGPDERRNNGASPGNATNPVTPRGAHGGKDGDKSPRGVTNPTSSGTTTTTVPKTNSGRHVGPPTSVPGDGGRHVGPPTTNPNKGPGNNNGQHNGDGNPKSTVTTPKTVKQNNGKPQGSQGGNADGNGNAVSHALQQVSGGANIKGLAKS